MSESSDSKILTEETIPAYLEERWPELSMKIFGASENGTSSLKDVEVKAIQGGNVNYAFCITLKNGNKTLFLKQAPEFVAIFGPDGFPLTSERMQREMDVYQEWKILLGEELSSKYLPEIYYFDKKNMVVIMEFLDGYELLDHVLVGTNAVGDNNKAIATCLGDFMGKTHAKTHSTVVDAERRQYLTKHFENREMRDIQLEFVFTKCYKEATDEQRAGLTLTPEFRAEVELLKKQYNGDIEGKGNGGLVLTHGDLHPGSVMVDISNDKGNGSSNSSSSTTKVIDPEFTVYGPAGLDVGSLLSGYCLGAIHQAYSDNPQAVTQILEDIQTIWDAYSKAMLDGGLSKEILKAIEIESVGFTVAEVCRTALEFAGGRKWLQFENDPTKKAAAKKAALQVVDKCMIARHSGGLELLLKELKAVVSLVSPQE